MKTLIKSIFIALVVSSAANAGVPQTSSTACTNPANGWIGALTSTITFHASPLVANAMANDPNVAAAVSGGFNAWIYPSDIKANVKNKIAVGATAASECSDSPGNPVLGYISFLHPPTGCNGPLNTSALASTWSNYRSIYVNADFNYTINTVTIGVYSNGVLVGFLPDLQTVIGHEFGHVYGVNHQYTAYNQYDNNGQGTCGNAYTDPNLPSPNPNLYSTCYREYVNGVGRALETMSAVANNYVGVTPCQRDLSPHDIGAVNQLY